MACLHKFADYLNLNQLDFEPTTLIVGTFNPGWDSIKNPAKWFYGRTRNNYFWDVLPRIINDTNLRKCPNHEWKAFCRIHRIAITDLLYSIEDADENNSKHLKYIAKYKDTDIANHFKQFKDTDIVKILNEHSTISQVFLTRQKGNKFWDEKWEKIVSQKYNRTIKFAELITPSGSARFQMDKKLKQKLRDFIFYRWQRHFKT